MDGLEDGLGQTAPALLQPRIAPRQPVAPQAVLPPDDLQQMPDEDEREATGPVGTTATVGSTDIWTQIGDHPSPTETLIAEGRLAEAYWLSRAAGEREELCQSLAFAASAFGLAPGQQTAMTLQLSVEEERSPLSTAEDPDGYLIALAAAVRSGLQAGWALPIVNDFAQLPDLPEVWNELPDSGPGDPQGSAGPAG